MIRSHARLDLELFLSIAQSLGVTARYAGEEPFSQVSIRSYPGFLKKQKIINADQEKRLRKLIVEAQNDDLRNKMMHGEKGRVSLSQVENCRKTIYKINEIFISIADRYEK